METINTTTPTNAGKGLYVAGFVIALVALVLWIFISGAAVLQAVAGGGMGLAIFWTVLSILGATFSIIGLMKARSANGKKGLAIAGMIIGLLSAGLCGRTIYLVNETHKLMSGAGTELLNQLEEGIKDLNTAVENSSAAAYKLGDKVQAEWKGTWYPAEIIEVMADGKYKIHYDGFGAEYDEAVGTDRLKL